MARVVSGLERWVREGPAVAGLDRRARIGLLAHAASVDARGRHALELLRDGAAGRLTRLFGPEHGLDGLAQDMEALGPSRDALTGLPVVSLYGSGEQSLRPAPAELAGLDAIVCDLQDVGARYYTFVYTIAHVMEAAREAALPVVVLDRPNPLGGLQIDGPVLEPALASFVGRYPIPVCHGMTCAELARLFNDGCGIGCDLRVVPLEGWSRATRFAGTGLPWVAPSPNMPTPTTAEVYPGGCLVEGTNLSEGRGTTQPFELVGAPWLDAQRLAEALRALELDGAQFRPAGFRPMFQKHAGRTCRGVQVLVTDPGSFRPLVTYLALLIAARDLDPGAFAWRAEPYEFESERLAIDLLLGRADQRPRIEAGASAREIESSWREGLDEFAERRRPYLLYR